MKNSHLAFTAALGLIACNKNDQALEQAQKLEARAIAISTKSKEEAKAKDAENKAKIDNIIQQNRVEMCISIGLLIQPLQFASKQDIHFKNPDGKYMSSNYILKNILPRAKENCEAALENIGQGDSEKEESIKSALKILNSIK